MGVPGFCAESALGPSKGIYRGQARYSPSSGGMAAGHGGLQPQQLIGRGPLSSLFGDCFGTLDDCLDTHCAGLSGQERAKCFAACQKPAVCKGCSCSCSPNCVRTCSRECTKTTPSAFLRCWGPCFPFGDLVLEQV
jgi:hypothetical protein